MKTNKELIELNKRYFNACSKHLFVSTKESLGKNITYFYLYTVNVNDVDYRVNITLTKDKETNKYSNVKTTYKPLTYYPVENSEYSDLYFTPWLMNRSIRWYKEVKDIIEEAKEDVISKIKSN